jgi:sn-glycerol 3-phosphate transport system substrate-binding protein
MFLQKQLFAAALLVTSAFAAGAAAPAPVEIRFWHSQTGAAADRVNALAERFNASQKNYKLVTEFKGSFEDSMAALLAVHGANGPDIIQVADAGSGAVMAAVAAGKRKAMPVKPFYQVMAEAKKRMEARDFLPEVAAYYSDKNGRLLSLPFDASTPVMFYNRDAFKAAGLDPDAPPKTWPELQKVIQAISDKNVAPCGYTTGWQSWIHVENLHAWDDEEFATKLNGIESGGAALVFNDRLEVRHIALMEAWLKGELASHSKSDAEAVSRFTSAECAVLTAPSSTYAHFKQNAKFDLGVARLPYYEDYKDAPQNTLVGGSSLWTAAGRNSAAYKGVADFFAFFLQPEVQAEWHQQGGSLPVTLAAYQLSRKQGYYEKNPGAEVAVLEVSINKPTPISRGIRLGSFIQIRAIIDEELEQVWRGKKPAKQALDDAVRRGNELLRKFDLANK